MTRADPVQASTSADDSANPASEAPPIVNGSTVVEAQTEAAPTAVGELTPAVTSAHSHDVAREAVDPVEPPLPAAAPVVPLPPVEPASHALAGAAPVVPLPPVEPVPHAPAGAHLAEHAAPPVYQAVSVATIAPGVSTSSASATPTHADSASLPTSATGSEWYIHFHTARWLSVLVWERPCPHLHSQPYTFAASLRSTLPYFNFRSRQPCLLLFLLYCFTAHAKTA